MKRLITLLSALALLLVLFAVGASAEEQPCNAYVTISVKGSLVAVQVPVALNDYDSDGALTVNDALYGVHKQLYDGGADAGYAYYTGDYGLSMSKLWGDESGSFGYYLNSASCMSLATPVKSGDYVTAFVYASADWSDTYSFFDVNTATVNADESVTLTLSAAGYDESWNPITVPAAGATITVDGQATEFVTDAEGKVTLSGIVGGEHVISATSATQTLVPPVCKLTVAEPDSTTEIPTKAPETPEATGCKSITSGTLALIALCSVAIIKRKGK